MDSDATAKEDVRNLPYEDLLAYLASIGEKPYRAAQIFEWLYSKHVGDFKGMKNLPAALQTRLAADYAFFVPAVIQKAVAADQTTKFLFELKDKEKIETVLIPTVARKTACVSTQVGCKFGCRFCASGIGGWARNLSQAEILSQVLAVNAHLGDGRVSHIVFMGIGEPLDNYDNLMRAIRIINAENGLNIAARRITISTCGVIPRIRQLATEGLQIELAISLHGFDNESRNVLMPVNRKYPFDDLIAACREYIAATRRQITFEYILIKDVTCTPKAAESLKKAFRGLICKMNLIPYNPVAEFAHKTPSREEMLAFKDRLARYGIHATIRTPRGRDAAAACGQLRHLASQS